MWVGLFEELGSEFGKVDAPVFPDVSVGGFAVYVWVAFGVEKGAEGSVGVVEEVFVTDGYPVELGRVGELHGEFVFKVVVNGRFRAVDRADGGGEEAYVVEHVGVFFGYLH